MKITFTIRNKTDWFYTGLATMSDADRFAYLNKNAHGTYAMNGLSMKVGTGQFRDCVTLNQIIRGPCTYAYKIEPRRGYKLITFEITRGNHD